MGPVSTQPRNRARQRLLALAAGLLLAPLCAEGAYRLWLSASGRPFDPKIAARSVETLAAHVRGTEFVPADPAQVRPNEHGMALHPYVGYQIERFLEARDNGRDYWTSPEAAADYDVLVLGGSVAVGLIGTWREQMLPLLQADPRFKARNLRVHWRTCAGHKQPQHANNLQWALSLGDRPDLVILLDGFNELAVAAENATYGVHPLYPMWTEMQAGLSGPVGGAGEFERIGEIVGLRKEGLLWEQRTTRHGLTSSALLAGFVERRFSSLAGRADRLFAELRDLRATALSAQPSLITGPPFPNDPARIQAMSLDCWSEGSRSMHAACAARGIRFLHVLQPAARDPGSKPLTAEEEAGSMEPAVWRTSVELGYPKLREAGARLAALGIDFLDASDVFRDHPEALYKDHCHFTPEGYGILDRRIAEHLLAVLPKEL